MDWTPVFEKINQVAQFKRGVEEGVVEGAKSMAEGIVALPGQVVRANLAVAEGVFRSATDPAYREQIFERVVQLSHDTAEFGTNAYRDPQAMTSAAYQSIKGKVGEAKQAFEAARALAEKEGRLGQFYGKLFGRGGFEVGSMLVPVSKLSKLGLVGKAGGLLKAGEEAAAAGKALKGAKVVETVLKPAEAAAEARKQYAKRPFDFIARCPNEAKTIPCFKLGKKRKFKKLTPDGKKAYIKELAKQLRGQEEAINNMTADEFKMARDKFMANGRHSGASDAQERYREIQSRRIEKSIQESLEMKVGPAEARRQAKIRSKDIMSTLAALHEPDMVSGGWHDLDGGIKRVGRSDINSSIGASWNQKGRLSALDEAAKEAHSAGKGGQKMNIRLVPCVGIT